MKSTLLKVIMPALLLCSACADNQEDNKISWENQAQSDLAGTSWETTSVTFIDNFSTPNVQEVFASACDRPEDNPMTSMNYLKYTSNHFEKFSFQYDGKLNIISMEPCLYPDIQVLLVEGSEMDLMYSNWLGDFTSKDRPIFKTQILEKTATTMKIKVLSNLMSYREDIYAVVDVQKVN